MKLFQFETRSFDDPRWRPFASPREDPDGALHRFVDRLNAGKAWPTYRVVQIHSPIL